MDFSAAIGAGGVGVEVDDDVFGEAAEQAHLRFGEGGAGGGDDVVDAGHEDGDAVHLAFDEQREVVGAHVGLGLVEIEEDLALGVERGLGRVDVLGDVAALSSVASRARAVKAMVLPCSLAMGKVMRLRKRA